MHERNIYKHKRPDFGELAKEFESFAKHVKRTPQGACVLDFKNPEALRELTYCLLKRDFNISIEIPIDRLIPTIPLRLNYIHWIEDLLTASEGGNNSQVRGIDIGCGASCIYPLLGARMNQWTFIATDVDDTNIQYAKNNVIRNGFTESIIVKHGEKEKLLSYIFDDDSLALLTASFCMCNPPFFSDRLEASGLLSRTGSRAAPKSVSTASDTESITEGGEVEFVKALVHESLVLKDKVKWYTSMLGKKESLKILKAHLKALQIPVVTTTEFYQGKTMRWGIAWSFFPDMNEKSFHRTKTNIRKSKPFLLGVKKSTLEITEGTETGNKDFQDRFYNRLEEILNQLQISIMDSEKKDQGKTRLRIVTCKGTTNTWVHQRKRRRAAEREKRQNSYSAVAEMSQSNPAACCNENRPNSSTNTDLFNQIEGHEHGDDNRDSGILTSSKESISSPPKESTLPSTVADLASVTDSATQLPGAERKRRSEDKLDDALETPLVFCLTVADGSYFHLADRDQTVVQFDCVEGQREVLHQLYLFIKNKLNGVQLH